MADKDKKKAKGEKKANGAEEKKPLANGKDHAPVHAHTA
jgi:hypothetical protein